MQMGVVHGLPEFEVKMLGDCVLLQVTTQLWELYPDSSQLVNVLFKSESKQKVMKRVFKLQTGLVTDL